MSENENALTAMLGEVDELGQVGFGVGERRFAHMTNMTNLVSRVQSAREGIRGRDPRPRICFGS